jgi:hypothetical protein
LSEKISLVPHFPNMLIAADHAWKNFLQKTLDDNIDIEKNEIGGIARNVFILKAKALLLDRKRCLNESQKIFESKEDKYRRLGGLSEIDNLIELLKIVTP